MNISIDYQHLLQNQAFIGGRWMSASDGKVFEVKNPFDGEIIERVPDMGVTDTRSAIQEAEKAFKQWSLTTASQRSRILRKWFDLQLQHKEALAVLLTLEQGKPLKEARGEIVFGAGFVEWFAEEAKRAYGDVIPTHSRDKRVVTIKQPIGVVAAITPWNFPSAMITRKVAPALAAGCTVVIKPAEDTPLSALALAVLAEEAGFPPGVINVITTNRPEEVGLELSKNPVVRKLSFTGSTAVGKLLLEQSASTVKKVSLELGGNAPFIVFEDADVDAAVTGAITSKYRNAGQTCICANRLFAHKKVYEEFTHKLSIAAKTQTLGSGLQEGTNIGPMINGEALQKMESLVADAVEKGAKVLTGGEVYDISSGHNFFQPTVLTEVNTNMAISEEEIFGPVAPVFSFSDEEEVIAMANNTPYGLAAYFYGNDYRQIWRVAEALEYGMIGINTGMISTVVAPFGGVKESGIGREGSKYGIDEYLEVKYLCFGDIE